MPGQAGALPAVLFCVGAPRQLSFPSAHELQDTDGLLSTRLSHSPTPGFLRPQGPALSWGSVKVPWKR